MQSEISQTPKLASLLWPTVKTPTRPRGLATLRQAPTLLTAIALVAMVIIANSPGERPDAPLLMANKPTDFTRGSAGPTGLGRTAPGAEWAGGAYGGVSYTYPSEVAIQNGDRTDMTISGFDWIGMPFKAPIYYGARIQRWGVSRIGTMLDFIHAKAIAERDDTAKLKGTRNGETLPPTARVEDVFRKLEFSHGHNMLTLNGMMRLLPRTLRLRPYVGLGGGVSLPHSEVGFRDDNVRTYEYQFTGFAGQALAGVEIQVGNAIVFLEYKFTYAPYDVPLTQRSSEDFLVQDVFYQLRDWWSGEAPPGGRLQTVLATHHAVGGVVITSVGR